MFRYYTAVLMTLQWIDFGAHQKRQCYPRAFSRYRLRAGLTFLCFRTCNRCISFSMAVGLQHSLAVISKSPGLSAVPFLSLRQQVSLGQLFMNKNAPHPIICQPDCYRFYLQRSNINQWSDSLRVCCCPLGHPLQIHPLRSDCG
jgi:hypothetical protein